MSGNLKEDHSYLYKRVRLKAVVHLVFGLILLFFPKQAPSLTHTPLLNFFGVGTIGVLYIFVAVLLFVGLYDQRYEYRTARATMLFAAMFNTMIFFSLFAVFFQDKTTAFFMAIYGYLTYNVWYVASDPGWRAIYLVKRIKTDGSNSHRDKLTIR